MAFSVYVASSFRHLHAVQLLTRELRALGCQVADWTEKAAPPEGLKPAERRAWMDTDHGGEVFNFCFNACRDADLVIYVGTAGQDAGVEVGMAYAAGRPVLGILGPLEAPGLMLHGAVTVWADSVERALWFVLRLEEKTREAPALLDRKADPTALTRILRALANECPPAK